MPELTLAALERTPETVTALGALLSETVALGGSVSFMHPLSSAEAEAFWSAALAAAARGERVVLGAWDGALLAGTVTLLLDCPPNQPHRAEIAKMMTRASHRGRGIATALLGEAERRAGQAGKTLLVLDTASEGGAAGLYERLGYRFAGELPDYALKPHGGLTGTRLYWKRIGAAAAAPNAAAVPDIRMGASPLAAPAAAPNARIGASPLAAPAAAPGIAGHSIVGLEATPAAEAALCGLLIECVAGGGALGFRAPLAPPRAAAYWSQALAAAQRGERIILGVWDAGLLVGSTTVRLDGEEHQPQRAEILKVMTRASHRGRGIASALLATAEELARAAGKSVLVLDTPRQGGASRLYEALGWQCVGEIPDAELAPDGTVTSTRLFWKRIAGRPEAPPGLP